MKPSTTWFAAVIALLLVPAGLCASGARAAGEGPSPGRILIERIGGENVTTGILYDLVLPLSGIERFDGGASSPPARLGDWKQMYHELYRASVEIPGRPGLMSLMHRAAGSARAGPIPIGILNLRYNMLRKDGSMAERRAFAAAALSGRTFRGAGVEFVAGPRWYFAGEDAGREGFPRLVEIDFDDGNGPVKMPSGGAVTVRYPSTGMKRCRVRCETSAGTLSGSFLFEVASLATPSPHDTMHVTASVPYEGSYAEGDAYVYLSDPMSSLYNPIVVIEGFDIDNTMFWDELYNDLNQEDLVERVRAEGFDVVVLNFLDSTDYIQRNSFVVVELLEQLQFLIPPSRDMALIGASMGGLCGRYALAWMENEGRQHNVRTFISFDVPHRGANIPLGIQYWVKFFSGESAAAAEMLIGLESASARQMLEYHFTDPPGTTGESDSLRGVMLGELDDLGGYPSIPRKVAVSNGSGHAAGRGFVPGEQVILYEYSSFLVDIAGDCWAVNDGTDHIVFDGLIDIILLPENSMTVYAQGTLPIDNAPGGSRPSMAQMDSTEAPYGDIIALHDSHCFIPTISALDIQTEDLFYDIAADPSIMSLTPFDTIYYAAVNESHVFISPVCADRLLGEVMFGVTDAQEPPPAADLIALGRNWPNPFNPSTTIEYILGERRHVTLRIYDAAGRLVTTLFEGVREAGRHRAGWDGNGASGFPAASGVYFCTLRSGSVERTRKIVLLR